MLEPINPLGTDIDTVSMTLSITIKNKELDILIVRQHNIPINCNVELLSAKEQLGKYLSYYPEDKNHIYEVWISYYDHIQEKTIPIKSVIFTEFPTDWK